MPIATLDSIKKKGKVKLTETLTSTFSGQGLRLKDGKKTPVKKRKPNSEDDEEFLDLSDREVLEAEDKNLEMEYSQTATDSEDQLTEESEKDDTKRKKRQKRWTKDMIQEEQALGHAKQEDNQDDDEEDGEDLAAVDEDVGDDSYEEEEDYWTIKHVHGGTTKIRKPKRTKDEKEKADNDFLNQYKEDAQHKRIMNRHKNRMALKLKNKEQSARFPSKVLDFSETYNSYATDDKNAELVRCWEGGYKPVYNKKTSKIMRWREMTEDEKASDRKEVETWNKKNPQNPILPCKCVICENRRKNEVEPKFQRGMLRSGLARGMFKYGEGRELGAEVDRDIVYGDSQKGPWDGEKKSGDA